VPWLLAERTHRRRVGCDWFWQNEPIGNEIQRSETLIKFKTAFDRLINEMVDADYLRQLKDGRRRSRDD
jgi:hypothetical protein